MKIILTKFHQEVTSVRKSITQVKFETSSRKTETAELPVIELNPELPSDCRTSPSTTSRRLSVQHKEAVPVLSVHMGEVTDIVELHDPSNTLNLSHGTYSMTGDLRGDPLRERYPYWRAIKPEEPSAHVQHEGMGNEPSLKAEKRFALFDLTVRKFIATQEMTGHLNRTEKGLSLEIDL